MHSLIKIVSAHKQLEWASFFVLFYGCVETSEDLIWINRGVYRMTFFHFSTRTVLSKVREACKIVWLSEVELWKICLIMSILVGYGTLISYKLIYRVLGFF